MAMSQKDIVKRFRTKVAGLRRMRRFHDWRESKALSRKIEDILQDLKAGVENPRKGVELVAAFFETDESVLGNCDDSSGIVGDVYRFDARELFGEYARRCNDKEWLGNIVLELCSKDEYGIRAMLIDDASRYLPEEIMRSMIFLLWSNSDKEKKEHARRSHLHLVESLARQLKDAPLFEKARRKSWPSLSPAACEDIARVYYESGSPSKALTWLERVQQDEDFREDDRDRLLLEVCGELGDKERQVETAWRIFRRNRGRDTLKILLSVVGADQKEWVIGEEAAAILRARQLSYSDARFLVEAGCIEEAESYLVKHREQLNGDLYQILLPLAKRMEKQGRVLAASLLYRALLDSIFKRALSKYYPYGVRYLRKLDELAGSVQNWGDVPSHAEYFEAIRHAHQRKRSFWSRYEASRGK
jgi:hypothetical protein